MELCVDDVCVTRDQFAEVFGNQSAAAGVPEGGERSETPAGSSAREGTSADTATVITTVSDSPSAPKPLDATNDNHAPDTGLESVYPTKDASAIEPSPAEEVSIPEPTNENSPVGDLPATGTQ